jgi:hypothetical protein
MLSEKLLYAAGVVAVALLAWYIVRPLNREDDERRAKKSRFEQWKERVDDWWNRQY